MPAERILNRASKLGASLALVLAVALGLLQLVAPSVSVGVSLAAAGLLFWWVSSWGAAASGVCAIGLILVAVLGAPELAILPSWVALHSWLGSLAETLGGLSLLSLRLRRRSWFNASVWFGAGVVTIAVLLLLNGAMGYGSTRSNIGAFLALLIGFSFTLTRMGSGFLKLIERKSPAGYIGRWMLVIVILVPALLHIVQLKTQPPTAHNALLTLVLTSFVYTMALLLVLMFSLRRLDVMEIVKSEAQAERDRLMIRLQEEAANLQQQVANRTEELAGALKASLRFDYLARATTNGIIIADAGGRIEWVNAAWEKFSGYSLAEVAGRKPGDFLHGPDSDPADRQLIDDAVRAGQPARGEMINYRKDGTPFWIELEIQPMRNEAGVVTNFFAITSDITERRRHAEEQRQLNERLGLALKALDCGVWDYDVVNNRQMWDRRQCEIYGFEPDSIPGNIEGFHKVVHPEDRERVDEACRSAAEAGDAFEYTFRIIRPDGATRHIAAHGIVRRDANGRVVRMVGLDRDITAAMELRDQLRVAEERWQLALAGTNDGVWDRDLETGKVFYDQRWAEMLGASQEQVLAEKDAWSSRIHPDDRPRALNAVNSHIANETPFYSSEFRMRHSDGHWVWIHARGRVVARDATGRALRITGTHADITARKMLEDQLRKSETLLLQLGELASIGAWEIDIDSKQVTWSPEIYRIHEVELGFTPDYDKVLDFYPEAARRVLQDALNSAAEHGIPFDLELPFTTAGGRKLWVRVKGRAESGMRARVFGVFQDITGRRDAEEMRRQLEGQLFQAQKMETLGTLAGGIAHDFNNLLTGILGYQDLALDTLEENHPSRIDLASAREASMRARELVEQILTFSRQAGSEKTTVNLKNVVADALRFLRASLPSTIGIEVDVDDACEPVFADATQIYQVILNLGSNAAHAMRLTGGMMRLRARPAAGDAETEDLPNASGRYMRIDFSDSGHGMSEETCKRIFDPFFTTKDVGEGTGLGLSVVHGIIQAHQGKISVRSSPGTGTTFTIHLPVADSENEGAIEDSEEVPHGNGELIAIVDDEDIVRSFSQMALARCGYKVETFDRPLDCLESFRARPGEFKMLLTDQTMPRMRGIDLAMEIRKLQSDIPVVIMSGYFSRIAPEMLAKLGEVELLSKPFTNEELARATHRSLNRG